MDAQSHNVCGARVCVHKGQPSPVCRHKTGLHLYLPSSGLRAILLTLIDLLARPLPLPCSVFCSVCRHGTEFDDVADLVEVGLWIYGYFEIVCVIWCSSGGY